MLNFRHRKLNHFIRTICTLLIVINFQVILPVTKKSKKVMFWVSKNSGVKF